MKTLEIGHDYGSMFGLPKGCSMVFDGDDTWTATKADGSKMTRKSPAQTAKVLADLSRPAVIMGSPR
ncbi:MAG: hypothetical protein WC563_15195 [Brevundimonas sp.]